MTDYPIPDSNNTEDIDIENELDLPDDTGQERSIARRLALQILYEIDSAEHPTGQVIANQLSQYNILPMTHDYTVGLVNGVLEHLERLDMIIQTSAQEWPLDQVAIIDRNILRIAVYEYGMLGKLPKGVVSDEGMNLARMFGSDSSLRFVNGVLGSVFDDDTRLQKLVNIDLPDDDEEDNDDEYIEYDPDEDDLAID